MKQFSTLFKIELKLAIRQMDSIFFGVLFPVGVVLLLGLIYGSRPAFSGAEYTMMQLSFGGFTAFGLCATGVMGLPLGVADYRHRKILKRFKVTPVSPGLLLGVQMLVSFVIAIASALATYIVATVLFKYTMIGSTFKFVLAYLLVAAAMYSLGMLIASLAPNIKTANLVCSLVYFPMIFLSGATVPYEVMPKGVQAVVDILPLTQGIKLLKGVSLGEAAGDLTLQLLLMAGMILICIAGSIKFFRWE